MIYLPTFITKKNQPSMRVNIPVAWMVWVWINAPKLPSISRFGNLSNSDQVVRASAPQRPIKIRPLGRPKPPFSEGNPPPKCPEQFSFRNSTSLPRIISWSRYPTKREVRKLIFKSAGLGVDMLASQEGIFIHNKYFTDPTAASTSWWYFLCIYTL